MDQKEDMILNGHRGRGGEGNRVSTENYASQYVQYVDIIYVMML